MSAENKAVAHRFFEEFCNGRNQSVAEQIFTSDHAYNDPSDPNVAPGPEGMKQLIGKYQRGIPDAHWTVEEMLDAGDRVVTRWTGTGVHSGDLAGIPATGRSVHVRGIWIHRFANGKIVESWNVWDTLGMFRQLGLVADQDQAMAHAR